MRKSSEELAEVNTGYSQKTKVLSKLLCPGAMHIIFDSGLPQPRSYQHPHINNTTQHLSTNIKYVNISCSFFPCSYSVYVLLVYQPQQPFYKLTEFPSFFLSTRHILPIFPPHPPTKLQTSLSLQSSSSEIATSPTSCTNPLIFRMALKKSYDFLCASQV